MGLAGIEINLNFIFMTFRQLQKQDAGATKSELYCE
jgi:hypothetical protein